MNNINVCEYCRAEYYTPLNYLTMKYSGIEIALNNKSKDIRVRAYLEKDIPEAQEIIRINYCPMCRKKVR